MRKLQLDDLNRLPAEAAKNAQKLPVVVLLDNIRSLHNVGSLFRTCDALAISKLYLCGITGTPPHREIEKTALGATESVHWEHAPDILQTIQGLKAEGYVVLAIEQVDTSISLLDLGIDPEHKYALILGNEVEGVQQEVLALCDACVEIPQFGTKHSFNVSVSAGIVLWDVFRKYQVS